MSDRPPMSPVSKLAKPPPRRPTGDIPPPLPPVNERAPEDAPQVEQATLPRPEKSVRDKSRTVTQPGSAASTGGTKRTTVSLPVALSEALTARAAAEGSSAIRVIIDAVKAGVGRLDDLVAAERTLRGEGAAGDDLFDVPGHRPWNEPLTVRDLTTTQRNISVLTELANKHAGENRSLLITAVLRDYLD